MHAMRLTTLRVRTTRDQKKFSFIEVNDGSSLTGESPRRASSRCDYVGIQVVAESGLPTYGEVSKFSTGAAVEVEGHL